MTYLHSTRSAEDQDVIIKVCSSILFKSVEENKPKNNEWVAIYIDGRNREINDVESVCAIKSFKIHSKYDAPVYCFINNDKDFFGYTYDLMEKWNLRVIRIPEINSLEEYSKFWIKDIFDYLPPELEHIITLQPDAMLLKSGFEDFILNSGRDWLSPHWKHYARIEANLHGKWDSGYNLKPTCIGNGGFSYRKVSKIKQISSLFKDYVFREYGRNDDRAPMEDLFFTFLGTNAGWNMPTLRQCDEFAVDPLTLDIWNDKVNLPYGFHYFRSKSEFPPCNHG